MQQQETSIFDLSDQFNIASPFNNWLKNNDETSELPKNILFERESDKEYVRRFTNPDDKLYSKEYAEKIRDIGKSSKTFQFSSFIYKEQGHLFKGGRVAADPNDDQFIFVLFTKGDAKYAQRPDMGHGPYFALWEETFHAWEVATGALDLNKPTSLNEARAWKFAATAPGNKDTYTYTFENRKLVDYTVNYRINKATTKEVARWLALGLRPAYDEKNKIGYAGLGKKKNNKLIGIYYEQYGHEYNK